MKLIDRYIGKVIFVNTLLALFALIALFAFFGFLEELRMVGKRGYTEELAAIYVLLSLPNIAYQMFPVATLLGAITGLGVLATNSELIAIRAAGVSMVRLVWGVMKAGLLLIMFAMVIGEVVAPYTQEKAKSMRTVALHDRMVYAGPEGLWLRDGSDYINIQHVLPGNQLGRVQIYHYDAEQRLVGIKRAVSGALEGEKWQLNKVESISFTPDGIEKQTFTQWEWVTGITAKALGVVMHDPESLSAVGLYNYTTYLDANGLSVERYELALWKRLLLPIVSGVMIILALPFVFGPLRSVGIGSRILFGVLVGVGFHLVNQLVGFFGLVYGVPPLLSALIPSALFLWAAIFFLRRVT